MQRTAVRRLQRWLSPTATAATTLPLFAVHRDRRSFMHVMRPPQWRLATATQSTYFAGGIMIASLRFTSNAAVPPSPNPTATVDERKAPTTTSSPDTPRPQVPHVDQSPSSSTIGAANGKRSESQRPPAGSTTRTHSPKYVDANGLRQGGRRLWQSVEWWQRGILAGIGVCMGVVSVLYLLWEPFSSDATHQTKTVASNVLQDHEMRKAAFLATKQLVQSVLADDDAVELLVGVVHRLLAQDASRQSVALFLKNIFEDNYTQEVTKLFVLQIVQDDWVREQLLDVARGLTVDLLQDAAIRRVMRDFLVETSAAALQDESLHRTGGQAIRSTLVDAVNPMGWLGGGGSKAPAPTAAPQPAPQTDVAAPTTASHASPPVGIASR